MTKAKAFVYLCHQCITLVASVNSVKKILFVGDPNMHKTNPRWRKAAILKNRLILATV